MAVLTATGPCPHGIVDDVCWACTVEDGIADVRAALNIVEAAKRDVRQEPEGCSPYALARLERVSFHLTKQLAKYFGDRPQLDTEQQAMAFIKGMAQELKLAGEALLVSAKQWKDLSGHGIKANQAFVAGQRALKVSQELIG